MCANVQQEICCDWQQDSRNSDGDLDGYGDQSSSDLRASLILLNQVVKRENTKLLIGYVVETFSASLQPVAKLDTIRTLFRLWEQTKDKDKQA